MKKYFIETNKYRELLKCLEFLFSQKYTRFSNVNSTHEFSQDIFEFSCQIYKRGIISYGHGQKISNEFRVPKIAFIENSQWIQEFENISNNSNFTIVDKNFFHFNDIFLKNINREKIFFLDSTENNKNLDTVSEILSSIDALSEAPLHIIAIGGGITLDIAGFIASILSAKLTLVPTTFLACIDATIGGKTGVNFEPYGKNQVGSFYFCDEIIIAPHLLYTLTQEAIISGLCEALKHSWISGNFAQNKTNFEHILHYGFQKSHININEFILENLKTKLTIVSQDPFEHTNIRTILNFGHTFGHVIEVVALKKGKPMPHGIAVAHGMAMVIKRFYSSHTAQMTEFLDFLNQILVEYPFDFEIDLQNENECARLLMQDKKNKNAHTIAFSLPKYGHINLKEFNHG